MKILFLTSWYPSRLDPTLGNFIERHLRAVQSVGCEVMVLHETSSKKIISPKIESEYIGKTPVHHLFLPEILRSFNLPIYRKIERIVAEFNPALIHGHVMFSAGTLGQRLSVKYNLPMVFTEHWSVFKDVNKDQFTQKIEKVVKRTAEYCSFILPVSEDLGKSIAKKGIIAPQQVVYNCVDTSLFNYQKNQQGDKGFTFLHISNFDKRSKNTEGIIEAFSKLDQDARLVIAGDGDLEGLRRYAKGIHVNFNRLEFHGTLKYSQVAELMKKSNAHVLFSNYENLPCVIAESLCCGLPNIATAVGGVPEMIDNSNGLMIQPNDVIALTASMRQIIEDYPQYDRKEISNQAASKYSYEQIGNEFLEVYQKVLDPK